MLQPTPAQSSSSPSPSSVLRSALGIQAQEPTRAPVATPFFHPGQLALLRAKGKRKAARCGRRWGKNVFGETLATFDACKGRLVGWFAPEHKRLAESFNVIVEAVERAKKRSSKTEGMIETLTGGKVEFWSLEDENAGRSRKYHRIIIDEAAFTKPKKGLETWQKSIEPTLVDYDGSAIIMSNTNGIDPDNFMWQLCNEKKHGFVDFHAPTTSNPLLPLRKPAETVVEWLKRREQFFEELRGKTPPLVYQQEYLAEFVDWSGDAFFTRDSLLLNGQPLHPPAHCEAVYAVIDTAVKTGKDRDGTAVIYFAVSRNHIRPVNADGTVDQPYSILILDWDIVQMEGALLETWLPTVFRSLEHHARTRAARMGSLGAFIEDKASGMVLIQQAQRRNLPAHAIESDLTAMGKDERAISVSGYVYRGWVKITKHAFDKVTTYKETTRNHLLGQIVGFRVGDKDATREDDLLDCFTYGIAVALGNAEGF